MSDQAWFSDLRKKTPALNFEAAKHTQNSSSNLREIPLRYLLTYPYAHCSLLQENLEMVERVPKHRASQGMTGALGIISFPSRPSF